MIYSRERQYLRVTIAKKTHVELISLDGRDKKKAMIINICEGGALLKTSTEIAKRSFWNMKLFLFDDDAPIVCRGRVLHAQAFSEKCSSYHTAGIRFHELSTENGIKIRDFLKLQINSGINFASNEHAVS